AKPPTTSAMAPFGGEHHEIECDRGLDLEPCPAAGTSLIGRVKAFRHDSFVTGRQSCVQEGLRLELFRDDASRDQQPLGNRAGERCATLRAWPVENGAAIDIEAVEEERVERDALAQTLDL